MDLAPNEEARELVHGDAEQIIDVFKSDFYAYHGGLPTDVNARSAFLCKVKDQEVDNASKIGELYLILAE